MTTATDLKRAAVRDGQARTEQAGWSIVLTRPGIPSLGLGWMLSGKRKNGAAPNVQNLAFLRRFAVEVGAPDRDPEQPVAAHSRGGGTWVWSWEPTDVEMAGLRQDVAEQIIRENKPEDLINGTMWNQGMDPMDPRFAIVTMRFPTEGMPLTNYQGREASARMKRFAESFLAGAASARSGKN